MYTSVLEGLFIRGLHQRGRLSPELIARLKGEGLDVTAPLLPAYPVVVWARCIEVTASALFPEVDKGEAIRRVGEISLDGYAETLLGKALFGLLKVLGTRRSMLRMARNMSGGSNYLDTTVVELGPTDFRTVVNDVAGIPSFYQGVFRRAAELVGTQVQVDMEPSTAPACSYRVHW